MNYIHPLEMLYRNITDMKIIYTILLSKKTGLWGHMMQLSK